MFLKSVTTGFGLPCLISGTEKHRETGKTKLTILNFHHNMTFYPQILYIFNPIIVQKP